MLLFYKYLGPLATIKHSKSFTESFEKQVVIICFLQIFFDFDWRCAALIVPSLLLRDMCIGLSDVALATESDINFVIFE